MNREEFTKFQGQVSRYFMYIADVKNSTKVLKTRTGRREFQIVLNEVREMLNRTNGIYEFKDTGSAYKLIRKGDCIAFLFDSYADNTDIGKLMREWHDIIESVNIKFHKNNCKVHDIYFINEYLEYLENDSKNNNAIKEMNDYNNDKTLDIAVSLSTENFIEEDFIKTELEWFLSKYNWKVNKIEIKESTDEKDT